MIKKKVRERQILLMNNARKMKEGDFLKRKVKKKIKCE